MHPTDASAIPDLAPPDEAPALPRSPLQAWGEIVLCSGLPTQFVIGTLLSVFGVTPLRADGSLSGAFVFALSLCDTVLVLTLIVWFIARRGERPLAVFFGVRPPLREVAVGVLSVPFVVTAVSVLMLAIRSVAPALRHVPENPLEGLLGSQAGLLMFLFVVIVAGGLREELQRAFLLHRFRTDLGSAGLGLVVTSAAFGLGHTLQGWDAAIATAALGATWGALYLIRGSAIAPIVSHALFNAGELLRAFFAR